MTPEQQAQAEALWDELYPPLKPQRRDEPLRFRAEPLPDPRNAFLFGYEKGVLSQESAVAFMHQTRTDCLKALVAANEEIASLKRANEVLRREVG